ncbi:MAG: response regulator [Ferruginibacter sp.]
MQSKATILLAEDDQSLAFMIKDALTDEGYQVLHCPDGQSAIDTFAKSRIDICLLDIMMPLKDGYLVARRIRQQSDQVPIIFLSTKSDESDRLNGYDTGADDYISKPFSMKELLRKLRKCSAAVPSVCVPLSLTSTILGLSIFFRQTSKC